MIIGPLAYGGLSSEARRSSARSRPRPTAGATHTLESIRGDEVADAIRARSRVSSILLSRWLPKALVEHVENGDATSSIRRQRPGPCSAVASRMDRVGVRSGRRRAFQPVSRRSRAIRNELSVGRAAAPAVGGQKCFPGIAPEQQVNRLWETINRLLPGHRRPDCRMAVSIAALAAAPISQLQTAHRPVLFRAGHLAVDWAAPADRSISARSARAA